VRAVHRIAPIVVAVLLLATPAAHAAGGFGTKCGESPFECTHVTVPLDRSGAVPGKLKLYVERSPGGGKQAVFALAGGPGQGNSTVTLSFNRTLPLPRDHYLVVFDQRGTGRSGALNCPELERETKRPVDVRAEACAKRLGPKRALFTTRDSVEDLEAVRKRIGDDKITLYGVSYGTKVAVAYALRYPEHVDRLILDSVVEPEGQNPFDLTSFAALPRVLGEVCRGECKGVTPDLPGDVAQLAARLRSAPLKGPFVGARGKRRTVSITERDLYALIRAADLDPMARAEYPGAIRSALDGDLAPLLRLEHRFDRLPDIPVPPDAVQSLSFSLFTATLCEEAPLPWDRTAAPADRLQQARDHAAAIPDEQFAPFDRSTALALDQNSLLLQCSRWPAAAEAPALALGPLPDVPVLVLAGEEDERVASRFPQATVVRVPKTAHAVLGQPQTRCAETVVKRWFAGRPVGDPCAKAKRPQRVLPLLPAKLGDVKPAPGPRGRTLAATLLTLTDLYREHDVLGFLLDKPHGGGLRGGFWTERRNRLRLTRLTLVPGVKVSGHLNAFGRVSGSITIKGPVSGKLVAHKGVLTGRLGGKQVRVRFKRERALV
jgi:pimeloyl-ACP methyl ester carboxylesterase